MDTWGTHLEAHFDVPSLPLTDSHDNSADRPHADRGRMLRAVHGWFYLPSGFAQRNPGNRAMSASAE